MLHLSHLQSFLHVFVFSSFGLHFKKLFWKKLKADFISDVRINIRQHFFIDIFQVSSRTASVCRGKGSSSFSSHYFCHWHGSCKCNRVNLTHTQNFEIGVMFWMYQFPVMRLQANSAKYLEVVSYYVMQIFTCSWFIIFISCVTS